jgi:molecular chaperone GrpE
MTDEKDKPAEEIEFIPAPPAPGEAAPAPPAPPAAGGKKDSEAKTGGPESSRSLKDKIRKKDAELKALREELDALKETYLRKLADMENLRKRLDREKSEYQQYALSGLLLELLGVVDNFERALLTATTDADGKTLREGVELILRMFQNLLAKNGVRPIVIDGRAFDPNFHHAMTVEESESVTEPEVEEVLQKGYLHHDRLLRPTLVKVLVPKKGQ